MPYAKQYAELRDQLTLRDGWVLLQRAYDSQQQLVVVSARLVELIYRDNHSRLRVAQTADQHAAGADFSGPELDSPELALEMVFGKASVAFEQLQLQQAQRFARALDPMLEPNSRVITRC